ncbi:ankyrin repeat protein [Oesophagostomum dentatum]|uniref:Ankyrin repeat protein n=1 Tax=Oesophagostomum dentatum TaxID=61180 RepID=A0A0B1TD50_OESDE|nr:ankyrin repeat protein [Oesophagostomum dentatum]
MLPIVLLGYYPNVLSNCDNFSGSWLTKSPIMRRLKKFEHYLSAGLRARNRLPDGEVTHGLKPLHYACFINNVGAAKLLLNRGAKVDAVDEVGCSALHLCAEHGYYRMIKLLLQYAHVVQQYETPVMEENGKYPSRENIDEPLRLAIKNGHYECARLLLENGANPNAIYFDGPEITVVSPLDTNFIELLLEYGADPNVYDRKGLTPIMKACRLKENGIEAIRILHKYGGNVNAQADKRQDLRTPMHYAVLSGSAQLVKFLISLGAQVTMPKGYDKPSIIDIAVLKDDPELLKLKSNLSRILHKYGGNVNAQADKRQDLRTPMHYAVLSGSAQLVKFLISLGAQVTMPKGYDKPSIIDIAVLKDDPELLKIIIDAGADVNAVHTYIGSALHLAACSVLEHQYEILRLLLEAGADPNMQHRFPDGSQLKSPFVEYFRSRDVIIIDAGADVNAVHTYIGSALHLAACSVLEHQYEILRLLLEAGADPNMQHRFPDGSQLKSPFVEYFRSRDVVDSRVVHLLLAYGGKVVMRSPISDTRGQLRNVLRLAATREQPQVLFSMLELGEQFDVGAIDRLPLPVALKGEILQRAKNPSIAATNLPSQLTFKDRAVPTRRDFSAAHPCTYEGLCSWQIPLAIGCV